MPRSRRRQNNNGAPQNSAAQENAFTRSDFQTSRSGGCAGTPSDPLIPAAISAPRDGPLQVRPTTSDLAPTEANATWFAPFAPGTLGANREHHEQDATTSAFPAGRDDGRRRCTPRSGGGGPFELDQAARLGPFRRPGGVCRAFAHRRVIGAVMLMVSAVVGGVDT